MKGEPVSKGTDAPPRSGYRAEIDGLRALSVISVIVNHFEKDLLPNGHLGVDTFFVISGYVITASLFNSRSTGVGDFLLGFYSRRVKRLVPSLVLSVLVTSVLVCLFDPRPAEILKTGIASLFGLSNIQLYRSATDYFAADTELNAFTHTWSLGVEEQFYFLFPWMVWFLGLRQRSAASTRRLLLTIAALSAVSLAAFLYLSAADKPAAFYLMPPRFWELGTGCALFLLLGDRTFKGKLASAVSAVALAAIVGVLFLPFRFNVEATLAVVVLTTVLIATAGPQAAANGILTRPRVVYVGAISYSLYLWHWSVLSLSRWTVGIHWWTAPLQLALMFGLAGASFRFIEVPLRSAQWSPVRWRVIGYALGSSAVAAGLLTVLWKPMDGKLFAGKRTDVDESHASSRYLGSHRDVARQAGDLLVKCNMTPHHLTGNSYRPKPRVGHEFLSACTEHPAGSRAVVLVGDSFAQVSAPYVALAAEELGYQFRVVSGYSCPYPLPFSEIRSASAGTCKEVDERLVWTEVVDSLRDGDLLVVRLYLENPEYLDYRGGKLPPVEAYDAALSRLAGAVRAKGARLLVMGSNPSLSKFQVMSLSPQWFNLAPSPELAVIRPSDTPETSYYHLLDAHLRSYVQGLDGADYFSPRPYLCGKDGACRIARDGNLLYFDAKHTTDYAHDLMFEGLRGQIEHALAAAERREPAVRTAAVR
jgi:peptidoglycan/LPS O-acetylase OafA/YrhL